MADIAGLRALAGLAGLAVACDLSDSEIDKLADPRANDGLCQACGAEIAYNRQQNAHSRGQVSRYCSRRCAHTAAMRRNRAAAKAKANLDLT
jgi:hypothetical protein